MFYSQSFEFFKRKVSWGWMPIECLAATIEGEPVKFDEKTDVWSFGSTVYEIFNMGFAPILSSNLQDYLEALKSGRRPEKPRHASEGL